MIYIAEPYRKLFEHIGFTPEMIFISPAVKPWRTLPDRENCVWDLSAPAGPVRLHVKRFAATANPSNSPAKHEADGYRALQSHGIPTAELVAWGQLPDGRGFIATHDLAGFTPADKWVESGDPFDPLLIPTAELTAQLHVAGLHHRDLYLCHFLARLQNGHAIDLRLIDAARVRALPGPLTRRRWIVKDLAQFWFSTLSLPISDAQRQEWLAHYAQRAGIPAVDRLRAAIVRKSNWITTHDQRLRLSQPNRNISIPKI